MNFDWFFDDNFFNELLRGFVFELSDFMIFVFELFFEELYFSREFVVFALKSDKIAFKGAIKVVNLLEIDQFDLKFIINFLTLL